MTESEAIATLAEALVSELAAAGRTVAIAESCTGGWIAKALTDVSGCSQVFGVGIVSYSNQAKTSLLGVGEPILATEGAVSRPVVQEMAAGVLAISGADYAVAVSGIAGPDGGTEDKPVGTVWFAWAGMTSDDPEIDTEQKCFSGDRETIRSQTVVWALQGLRERLRKDG
ncbi:MAG: nicotinamide-nucleotide amidohydrolase family protein [Gammaproteobacteria bacterium]|nr:nicotinamide-nucleotide amidohydrolase family protein [Gammaproteobacteria bacterium]